LALIYLIYFSKASECYFSSFNARSTELKFLDTKSLWDFCPLKAEAGLIRFDCREKARDLFSIIYLSDFLVILEILAGEFGSDG